MTKRILILSEQDRACLLEMIERAQSSWRTYAPHLNVFRAEVIDATIVPRIELPPDRVMVGDRVSLLHARPSMRECLRLMLPYAHPAGQGDLSVLSPLGAAILGARSGEYVQWLLDDGPRQAFIEEVVRDSGPPGASLASADQRDFADLTPLCPRACD
jgi:regulator of nucleoside diphosphate kinase